MGVRKAHYRVCWGGLLGLLVPLLLELSITHNFCELVGTAHEADSR